MSGRPDVSALGDTRRAGLALRLFAVVVVAAIVPFVTGAAHVSGAREPSWPHARAGVGCASCHAAGGGPAAACTSCHARAAHPVRDAHRALAERGSLGCTTCHAVHDGARGVAFDDHAAFVWGTGMDVTPIPDAGRPDLDGLSVPTVAAGRCTGCHDLARASDPIARCLAGSTSPRLDASPITCLDEHRAPERGGAAPVGGAGECRRQHTALATVAEDTARPLLALTQPPRPRTAGVGAAVLSGTIAAFGIGLVGWRRRVRPAARRVTAPRVGDRVRLPTIDASTCLGCRACVDACPFDVLAVRGFVAEVARPEACCGVVLCADVCPNGSLRIQEGEPTSDHPVTNGALESADVPGLYLAGDVTGLPLIKNAIAQGALAAEAIAAEPKRPRVKDGELDVLVVGAGPAGLSAGLRATELGLRVAVIEQATLAASIQGFPRDKIVQDPPLHVPVVGPLWLEEARKEELVAQWTRIVRMHRLDVREGLRLVGLRKEGGGFAAELATATDERSELRAVRVVLAVGRRGSPRRLDLDVTPGAEHRVLHALSDAQRFAGRSVVIAGLGDTAMEAAMALAAQRGTVVTVSYRGDAIRRGKARNVAAFERLVRAGRIRVAFGTVPVAIGPETVTLRRVDASAATEALPADVLFVLLGGVPAWDLLARLGIRRPGQIDPGAGA